MPRFSRSNAPDTETICDRWGRYPGRDEHEDYFYANNRSKKSIALDLKNPNERAVGQDLAKAAHVVVENFSPGTAHRLGMGWEDLQPLNPKLIYCSLSGFGQTGPSRDRYALDPHDPGDHRTHDRQRHAR